MPALESIVVPPSRQQNYDTIHYAQAVRAGGLLFISGQTGIAEDGSMPEGIEAQTNNAFAAIAEALEAAGLGMENLVTLTTYHVGDFRTDVWDFMKVKDEWVQAPYPAWSAVGVDQLAFEGALVEIVAIASLD